jgi:hypothetical protein
VEEVCVLSLSFSAVDKTLFEPTKPLVFMHVPKSAGSSMIHGLVSALQPKFAMLSGFDVSLFGTSSNFVGCDQSVRKLIYVEGNEFPWGADFVAAHMSRSTLIRVFPDGQLVTIFREPVSRLLSLWVYWRALTDEQLKPWGAQWGECLRSSRRQLVEFLSEKTVACQTDNQIIRMLLWPHSLIPAGDFIEARHDMVLMQEAVSRLRECSYCDVLENPDLESRCAKWICHPFALERKNETGRVSQPLRAQMTDELTSNAWSMLGARSRLDLFVWQAVASCHAPQADLSFLRREAIAQTIARLSAQLAN